MCDPNNNHNDKLEVCELLLLVFFSTMIFLLLVASVAGCAAPPAWTAELDGGTNAVVRAMRGGSSSSPAAVSDAGSDGGLDSSAATTAAGDSIDFAALRWVYGGFNGSAATPVAGCEIADLRVSSSGLSYRWAQGGCEALGAADRGDASRTIACFFCLIDGQWRGSKIDWISTSRTTRSFENIRSGYKGWDKDAIEKAKGFAFVIVSKDGQKRTNIIVKEGAL